MKKIFQKIWKKALPYQDKRDDKGHAEIATDYALKLLETEKGNEEIIIPAIILHDIGWSQLSKKERMVIFKNNATKEEKLEVRFAHQDYGVKLARKILNEVNYPVELIEEILEIISQHDTRDGFISQNEGITRDADKLYRFSKVGFIQALTRYDYTFEELYNKETSRIKLPGFIFSESAKHIAKDELETRKKEYH